MQEAIVRFETFEAQYLRRRLEAYTKAASEQAQKDVASRVAAQLEASRVRLREAAQEMDRLDASREQQLKGDIDVAYSQAVEALKSAKVEEGQTHSQRFYTLTADLARVKNLRAQASHESSSMQLGPFCCSAPRLASTVTQPLVTCNGVLCELELIP